MHAFMPGEFKGAIKSDYILLALGYNKLPVHWLTGGAWTLQTPGSANALVLLMDMPKEAALPSIIMQRHRGSDWTTPASTEQQEIPGSGDLLEMKSRQGERVIIALEQPLLCAVVVWEKVRSTTAARPTTAAIPVFRAAILGPRSPSVAEQFP
jgi:hypothetical protein